VALAKGPRKPGFKSPTRAKSSVRGLADATLCRHAQEIYAEVISRVLTSFGKSSATRVGFLWVRCVFFFLANEHWGRRWGAVA
jgi:hypothetical protein